MNDVVTLHRRKTDPASTSAFAGNIDAHLQHQTQYDGSAASFFDVFNRTTNRQELFYGVIAAHADADVNNPDTNNRIAVDFGCGTGGLTPRLTHHKFKKVFGIDKSKDMLTAAIRNTSREITEQDKKIEDLQQVIYRKEIPENLQNNVDFLSAIHVHYHFEPLDKLKNKFFGTISEALKIGGEAVIIGCPSDHIAKKTAHYFNSVHISNIPQDILDDASDPDILKDDAGYIPLHLLNDFPLKDGLQMKVTLIAGQNNGSKPLTHDLIDTFWSDQTLIAAAKEKNLELVKNTHIGPTSDPHAYMAMTFKKIQSTNTLHA